MLGFNRKAQSSYDSWSMATFLKEGGVRLSALRGNATKGCQQVYATEGDPTLFRYPRVCDIPWQFRT